MSGLTIGSLLKIQLSDSEALYFKVIKSEITAIGVKQVCSVRKNTLHKDPANMPCSYIYKSEIGVNYQLVDEEEKVWLREKYQSK